MSAPWDEPIMKREGDDFIYSWPGFGVGIAVSHLHEGSKGEVHGELTIYSSIGPGEKRDGVIEWCQLNLAAQTTRKSLATALTERNGHLLDWGLALKAVAYRTTELYRTGEPTVDLSKIVINRERRFLIDKILPAGQVSIFYGDGMGGKSLTAALVAIAVQTNRTVLGCFRPCYQANVLYLDWETDADEQADRIDQLSAGLGVERPPILYRHPVRLLADEMAIIRREIDKHRIGLLIVDSMHLACGNVVDFDAVARFNSALTSVAGVAKIVVTHVSKASAAQDSGKSTPLGLAQVNNYGRSNWEFRAERGDPDAPIEVGMFHRKVNGFPMQRPIGIRYIFDSWAPMIRAEWTDIQNSPTLVAHSSNVDRIRSALRGLDAASYKEVAELAGLPENIVRATASGSRMPDITSAGIRASEKGGAPIKLIRLVDRSATKIVTPAPEYDEQARF